jgi:hypothetical protein
MRQWCPGRSGQHNGAHSSGADPPAGRSWPQPSAPGCHPPQLAAHQLILNHRDSIRDTAIISYHLPPLAAHQLILNHRDIVRVTTITPYHPPPLVAHQLNLNHRDSVRVTTITPYHLPQLAAHSLILNHRDTVLESLYSLQPCISLPVFGSYCTVFIVIRRCKWQCLSKIVD